MSTERHLHQILLQPTDVLFFRDGRPMGGSLAGHTASWPLPDVTNHALHAALHRAGLNGVHGHDHHTREGRRLTDARKFGSLLTAGPLPVQIADKEGRPQKNPIWFFPRPKDAQLNGNVAVTLRPVLSLTKTDDDPWLGSSLPDPLEYAVANTQPPDKEAGGEPWISSAAFEAYLADSVPDSKRPVNPSRGDFLFDTDLADIEQAIGIGIDPATGTQDKTNFYSANYLRLREGFRLGLFAEAMDKVNGDSNSKRDLLKLLFNDHPQSIIVGGQQRICSAERTDIPPGGLPLPRGLTGAGEFRRLPNGTCAVKWVLLTPAIWPEIPDKKKDGAAQNPHPGGWLPNWVFLDWDRDKRDPRPNDRNGQVLLTAGPGVRKAARTGGVTGADIAARLVAAIVPKPIVVTGWALGDPNSQSEIANQKSEIPSGAKSTHLAVPAGAVYYFEAESPKAAAQLAAALNWHGSGTNSTSIKNRRSTLMGEKGFGLGVCGTWKFFGT